MIILINTTNNITLDEDYRASLTSIIESEVERYNENITRLEVHLDDENSAKEGGNDKRCTIEARPEGLKPITVTDKADTFDQAVSGATDKLMSALNTTYGKMRNY
jgi:ribosome-associated translation inhibitor RaiA